MEQKNIVEIVLCITIGLVFIIGFGIGVQLYESTPQGDRQDRLAP